jgi:hypothetical protein
MTPRDSIFPNQAVDDLRAKLRGAAILLGEGRYDDSRALWNAMIDLRPAVIMRPPAPPT